MADIFSDFSSLGLGDLSKVDLYQEPEKPKPKKAPAVVKEIMPIGEKDILFDKSYTCPVCDEPFKNKTIRTGKNRLIRIERDLRQVYTPVDQVKYDVIACPHCGYAALGRYFDSPSKAQIMYVKNVICANYLPQQWGRDYYSYADARKRYQLALGNAMAKHSKSSEKAYICLKTAWVIRGERDAMDRDAAGYDQAYEESLSIEKQYLEQAYDGFVQARKTEGYPMCGMDEPTTDYLIAALAFETGKLDVASKLVGTVLTSYSASKQIKDKTRELKQEIIDTLKKGL